MNSFTKIFVVLLIIGSKFCFAQDSEIDRLKTYIEQSKDDSTKVDSLIELSKKYLIKNPESAIHFANLAKNLSEKINYLKGLAKFGISILVNVLKH